MLTPDELAAVEAAVRDQIEDCDKLAPPSATLADMLRRVTERLLARMQTALRPRLGELASPLPGELFQLLVTGTLGEVMALAYRNLKQDEIEWPRWWTMQFDNGLAALASGVDRVAPPDGGVGLGRVAASSEPRQFTTETLRRLTQ